ncbi:MAG: site-specific integrase [Flavobacterium sp.]|nr:MAG: site-specific integrase [Flavobacterium sp.]
MKTNFSLLFYLKKQKNYQSGNVAVYMRITVNRKRSETSTGRECDPAQWNSYAGRLKGTKDEVKKFNAFLDDLQAKVYEAHRLLTAEKETITAESIRLRLNGKVETDRMLTEIFQEHNDKIKALIGKEFTRGTLVKYTTTLKHLKGFLKSKFNLSDIDVTKIDPAFISEFDFYVRSNCRCANNAAVKHLKNLGKIMRLCLANRWISYDPFLNRRNRIDKVDRVILNEEELQIMIDRDFSIERLRQVRDIFVFCCFTGLSFIDVEKLRVRDLVIGIDGGYWIYINRQKTDIPSRIPLLPAAYTIIQRYKDNPQCQEKGTLLPVSSNQKMNAYLKEVADLCGISKHLTFHIARHTFATTITLNNGIPIESVSKMLGHTSIKTTQIYAKVLDIKVSNDMALLREKFA